MLLPPTLLTGPPSTFKNYSSFSTMPMRRVQPQYLRWLVVLVSFEMFQHLLPVLKIHPEQSLLIMVGISLFHLVFIWYKFLTIWKTGRLWAHLYGFDVVDNMSRCICNNYGFEGFWRMWHRGFNQWLVRYLYIPLGGNRTVRTTILSTVSVIAFVAFWHDHTFNILLWAFLLVLCFVP